MTIRLVKRCQLCGRPLTDEDDEDYDPQHDDPNLCSMCQEVTK